MDLLEKVRLPDSRLVEAAHPGTEESAWVGETMKQLIRIGAEPTGALADLLRKLESFAQLAPNWDSYGGLPPTLRALEHSIQILKGIASHHLALPLTVVPTPRGGLQFDWAGPAGELEVEILPEGAVSTLWSASSGDHETTVASPGLVYKLISSVAGAGVHASATAT